MPHKHTLETDKHVNNGCIKYDEETDECEDKTSFHVALEVLKNDYKTKIMKDDENIFLLKENLKDLKTSVKNTDEKLGGGNPDNTILDDENTIKEIKEQFTYLTKTPDFITKIKDFLEKNNMFKIDEDTDADTDTQQELEALKKRVKKAEQDVKTAETELKKIEAKSPDSEEKEKAEKALEEEKTELEKENTELEKIKKKVEKKATQISTNKPFEIKKIDSNDMFVSELDDKLKEKYYFNINYYKSQAEFVEFKTQLNQLNELKKNYQDLILIFESAIKEFKNKKTNLEKLINTYFIKNSLSTKRETLNKFDDFIKNITKNVNNIKDIPKNLINFLEVKKSNIQTFLIQKSFPSFLNGENIEFNKLTISNENNINTEKKVKIENKLYNKRLTIESIEDDQGKKFNLNQEKFIEQNGVYTFTYKMGNSRNNHKLIINLEKDKGGENVYNVIKIKAEIDTNISYEKTGGVVEGDEVKDDEVKQPVQQPVQQPGQKSNQSAKIKGLNEVFNNLQKKIDYVIKQKIRDGVDVSGVKSKDIEKGDVGDDIIETLVLDYERKKQNVKSMDEKERIDREFLEKVNGLGLNLNEIFEVNLMDKFYFILYSLVLHIITYSIIESLIMSSNLNSLVSIMGIYSFLYVLLIILTLGIIHIYGYRGKVFLNYLNLDHNFYNIIGHFIIVAIFFGIILILSQYINTANIENEDERVKMLYRIEIITGVMFVFTTMFILIL